MDDITIDDVDLRILHQLHLDVRQTDSEIAEKVDVTSTRVRNRLNKLEDKGVIGAITPKSTTSKRATPLRHVRLHGQSE